LARAVRRIPAAATWPFPPATAGAQGVMAECRYWPPARPDPVSPGRTLTMPVLLLARQLDLSTPPPRAGRGAAAIPDPPLGVITGAGHGTERHSAQAAAGAQAFLLAPGRAVSPGRSR